ncbi:hypothetical protein B0G76_7227 [Paraburkholderia sp. BL23I1N1]|nr:hypothetical protein B0G76_7227 [Paraburkholderia sp. BL23I1N1]
MLPASHYVLAGRVHREIRASVGLGGGHRPRLGEMPTDPVFRPRRHTYLTISEVRHAEDGKLPPEVPWASNIAGSFVKYCEHQYRTPFGVKYREHQMRQSALWSARHRIMRATLFSFAKRKNNRRFNEVRVGARRAAGGMTALSLTPNVREHRFQMHHYRNCAGDPLISWRFEPLSFAYFSLRRQAKKSRCPPHRGNANRPIRKQGKANTTSEQPKSAEQAKKPNLKPRALAPPASSEAHTK